MHRQVKKSNSKIQITDEYQFTELLTLNTNLKWKIQVSMFRIDIEQIEISKLSSINNNYNTITCWCNHLTVYPAVQCIYIHICRIILINLSRVVSKLILILMLICCE